MTTRTYENAHQINLGGDFRHEEGYASVAITPGHLCELVNVAGAPKYRPHATAKGFHEKCFAIEDGLQGKTIDDVYPIGALVFMNIMSPGGLVQAWLKAGQNVVFGDLLESAGDGTLQKASGTADLGIVGVASENLNLAGSGAVNTRIDIRVL